MPKLFITIDWEGGIVSRVHEGSGFNSIPSPLNLAQAGRTYSFLVGKLIEHQCADVDINMNFAPSLDLFNKNNLVLASRPFSENPEIVIENAKAFCDGLNRENISLVIKINTEIIKINTEKTFR